MADQPARPAHGHLDASGPREVVFCHQCENEWYNDQHGLICPRCQGEITEIITPGSDFRDFAHAAEPPRSSSADSLLEGLHNHSPWRQEAEDSDPEEEDIEQHIRHGPGGSILYSQTIRTSTPMGTTTNTTRRRGPPGRGGTGDPDPFMRNLQDMLGGIMGPEFRPGQAGRSGPDTLFNQSPFHATGFRVGGNWNPHVMGGRFTFTTTGEPMRPRGGGWISPDGQPDQLATLLGNMFGHMGPAGGGAPGGLPGLLAQMMNPANARSGDAAYSQEALDQIISELMASNPSSNAPGPASPDAISGLPKIKLDEKRLGPEGKAECSVCMDDVGMGDEVVLLPCTHWFHEACAGAWLSEHNTCPICRKGIDAEGSSSAQNSRRSSQSGPTSRNEHRARRLSAVRPRLGRDRLSETTRRNEERLENIRGVSRQAQTPPADASSTRWPGQSSGVTEGVALPHHPTRWSQPPSPLSAPDDDGFATPMPGAFHRRASEMSENQRDSRRGYTSGSDRSSRTESRRSSTQENNGRVTSWLRDRFGSGSTRRSDGN